MLLRKLGWLAVTGSLLGLFIMSGSSACLALALSLVLIPLVSILVHLHIRSRLRLELSADANLHKGGTGELRVTVVNPTIFPASMRCSLEIRSLLNGTSQKLDLDFSASRGTHTFPAELGSAYCGRLRISAETLRLYDCFSLIGIRVPCVSKCHVTVQPDGFETKLSLLSVMGGIEDSDSYSQERPGWDLTEIFQLREYVPGDSPRQVHWKLSGKLDRLIVRDPGLPIVQDVLLFWERTGETDAAEVIDAQAEAVVSIARALLDQSVQFRLGWNDTTENRCILHQITDLDDLIGVLPRLLSAAGAAGGDSGAQLLLQTRPEALCSHMICIANTPYPELMEWAAHGHTTVLTCSDAPFDGAIRFDPENYASQLAMLEL